MNLPSKPIERNISIHALLAESDKTLVILPKEFDDFYPRSPCGERPHGQKTKGHRSVFLSTLSLRRATPSIQVQHLPKSISIHALLAESDLCHAISSSAGRISIHALLAESDPGSTTLTFPGFDFYPRSPCGERPIVYDIVFMPREFLSTLSLRRATAGLLSFFGRIIFLSTLSLRRATRCSN